LASNAQIMRKAWRDYRCILSHGDRRKATILGVFAGVCPPEMLEPFEALSQALTMAGYRDALRVEIPRPCTRGIKPGKCHQDGTNCSLHNYGVAVDVEPVLNKKFADGEPGEGWQFSDHPSGGGETIKLTKAQVDAVLAIRTLAGKQLFLWLGNTRINDTMHFEVRVPPDATAVDWSTVEGGRLGVPLRGMRAEAGTTSEEDEEDDMWQYLTVDESLVRHAFKQGWLEPKNESTLNFFLDAVKSGEINDPKFGDFRNFRVAVTNGIALSAGRK
jgi:D-alanyl-D-alanine carboxypeptidase